ncbi:MAG: 30S ribosomal protein S3 [Candidatus Bathyarchaeia archaeon]
MSVIKRVMKDSIERMKVDELLAEEFDQAGYGGITLTKTPLGAQINLFTMRPGRVIGRRGRAIKAASERLELELGISNPQITVVEVEVPELNSRIMASRIANALERGVHYRRAIFWALRRIMDSGAIGCEIVIRGKLRSDRSRFEKVGEGYMPKSGDPALKHLRSATMHVKLKRGTLGINVIIVPPEAKFPDKISLEGLPTIEYPEEEEPPLPEGVEPEPVEPEPVEAEPEAEPEKEEPASEEATEDQSAAQPPEPEASGAEAPAEESAPVEEKAAVEEALEEPAMEPSTGQTSEEDEPSESPGEAGSATEPGEGPDKEG